MWCTCTFADSPTFTWEFQVTDSDPEPGILVTTHSRSLIHYVSLCHCRCRMNGPATTPDCSAVSNHNRLHDACRCTWVPLGSAGKPPSHPQSCSPTNTLPDKSTVLYQQPHGDLRWCCCRSFCRRVSTSIAGVMFARCRLGVSTICWGRQVWE